MNNFVLKEQIKKFLEEDALGLNQYYEMNLPLDEVKCSLYLKSAPAIFAGGFVFASVFEVLSEGMPNKKFDFKHVFSRQEGGYHSPSKEVPLATFTLPFAVAIQGERLALNLLQRMCSIATFTRSFVEKVKEKKLSISILDTRKTTPGLRSLEKYAVRLGGGVNHRFTQQEIFMIKDNHKNCLGGIQGAIEFFKKNSSVL